MTQVNSARYEDLDRLALTLHRFDPDAQAALADLAAQGRAVTDQLHQRADSWMRRRQLLLERIRQIEAAASSSDSWAGIARAQAEVAALQREVARCDRALEEARSLAAQMRRAEDAFDDRRRRLVSFLRRDLPRAQDLLARLRRHLGNYLGASAAVALGRSGGSGGGVAPTAGPNWLKDPSAMSALPLQPGFVLVRPGEIPASELALSDDERERLTGEESRYDALLARFGTRVAPLMALGVDRWDEPEDQQAHEAIFGPEGVSVREGRDGQRRVAKGQGLIMAAAKAGYAALPAFDAAGGGSGAGGSPANHLCSSLWRKAGSALPPGYEMVPLDEIPADEIPEVDRSSRHWPETRSRIDTELRLLGEVILHGRLLGVVDAEDPGLRELAAQHLSGVTLPPGMASTDELLRNVITKYLSGQGAVAIERRPDGTYGVLSGRYELAVARECGFAAIPRVPGRLTWIRIDPSATWEAHVRVLRDATRDVIAPWIDIVGVHYRRTYAEPLDRATLDAIAAMGEYARALQMTRTWLDTTPPP